MKLRILSFILVISIATALCGCSNIETPPGPTPEITAPIEPAPETPVPETELPVIPSEELPAFLFEDVSKLEFYFSSGAGGWRTTLRINSDGSFEGVHSDSEMGITGDDYPDGTYYICQFRGSFTTPKKLNDYTYSFSLESLEYEQSDAVEIIDGIRYVNSTPYGIEGGEEFHLYLPGTPLSQLPELYIDWIRNDYYTAEGAEEPILPFYGLYNVTEECGFSSYKVFTPVEAIYEEISIAETSYNELEKMLDDPYLTQADMNIHSYELFLVWDNALNTIWNILKTNLDAETMAQLTEEEIVWITEKEAAMEEAGKECEGGSIYPCIVNGVATEYTRARVYVLAEYAKLIPAE